MAFDLQLRLRMGGQGGDDLQLIGTNEFFNSVLSFLATSPVVSDAPLGAYEFKTYKNPLVFTETTVIGDLDESTYPGYAGVFGDPWSAPGVDDAGNVVMVADLPTPFQVTGDPLGELLAGVFILGVGGDLVMGIGLAEPITLVDGLILPMTAIIQIGNLP